MNEWYRPTAIKARLTSIRHLRFIRHSLIVVNFLSHYAVGTHKRSMHYTLGCVLPDLVRNYRKGLRIPAPHKNDSELQMGVAHHFVADRLFHSSGFFLELSGTFKGMMSEHGYADRRYHFFTAHVALELLLDRALMRRDIDLLDRFYLNLAQLTKNDLQEALAVYDLRSEAGFLQYMEMFTSSRYLYHYQSFTRLIFALNRIHERVGLKPFDNRAVGLLVRMDATLQAKGLSIIEYIASELPSYE